LGYELACTSEGNGVELNFMTGLNGVTS